MNQKWGNNGQKFKRKFFFSQNWGKDKRFFKAKIGAKMAKLGKKTKTLRYEWIFGDRESLIPKTISKKFEFKAKTWAKMTKKQDYFKPKLEF